MAPQIDKVYATHFLLARDASGAMHGCAPELGESAETFKAAHERAGRTVTRYEAQALAELLKSPAAAKIGETVAYEHAGHVQVGVVRSTPLQDGTVLVAPFDRSLTMDAAPADQVAPVAALTSKDHELAGTLAHLDFLHGKAEGPLEARPPLREWRQPSLLDFMAEGS